MKASIVSRIMALALLIGTSLDARAQLFYENFDTDHTANWTVNKSTGANANNAGSSAEFFFDYSTVGIPSAPNSVGGSTRGLRLRANMTGGILSGLSVSPVSQNFVGDFRLTFDMWMNYQGGASGIGTGGNNVAGGNGTTQVLGYGIRTAGTTAQWAGGVHDSVHFGATVDGGATQDYRVYPGTNLATPTQFPNYYAAGNTTTPTDARNDAHLYYAGLGQKTAPAAQLALFPEQTGTTRTGASGFAWRQVEILSIGNTVTWKIDDRLIATFDAVYLSNSGGNNILFNYYDINAASSTDPNAPSLLFGLIDNIVITPEPTSVSLAFLGGVMLLLRRRK